VLARLREAHWAVAQGLPVSSGKQTLSEFLDVWLKLSLHRLRISTYRSYELNVRRLKKELGGVPLVRLSPPGIQEAYERLSREGLSEYSVLQVHRTLHRVLDRAFHWGLCPRNAAALVLPPRPRRRQMTALTSAQLVGLLETTSGQPLYPLWAVLGTAGLRLGEALGLQWRDVDLTVGRIHIHQALQRQAGVGLVLTHLKTLRSRRTVQLTQLALDALRCHQATQDSASSDTGLVIRPFVFTNAAGRPLDAAKVTRGLARALDDAGLPHIRVHDLRHTTPSALLEAGVHPKVVQELLGHSTVAVTLDTYSHVAPVIHVARSQLLTT
jgi:integrase